MKKTVIIALSLLLALSAASCSKKEEKPTEVTTASGTDTVTSVSADETTAVSPVTTDISDVPIVGNDWRTWGTVDASLTVTDSEGKTTDTLICLFGDRAEFYADSENQTLLFTLTYPETVSEPEKDFISAGCTDTNGDGLPDIIVTFSGEREFTYTLDKSGKYTYAEKKTGSEIPADMGDKLTDTAALSGFWYPEGDLDADTFFYFSDTGDWTLYEVAPGSSEQTATDSGPVYSDKSSPSAYYFGSADNKSEVLHATYDSVSHSLTFDGETRHFYATDAG